MVIIIARGKFSWSGEPKSSMKLLFNNIRMRRWITGRAGNALVEVRALSALLVGPVVELSAKKTRQMLLK